MGHSTNRVDNSSALVVLLGAAMLPSACGTLQQAANVTAFNDAEAACRPNLERCVDRCRLGDSDSCHVLSFLIADEDVEFSDLRKTRGDPPLSLAQLRKLYEDLRHLCSDGISRACPLVSTVSDRMVAAREQKQPSQNARAAAPVIEESPGESPKGERGTMARVRPATSVNSVSPKCDPVKFVDPQQAYPDQEQPYGTAREIADLDGDGIAEIEVDYETSVTSSGVTVLKPTNDGSCFLTVYSGPGTGVVRRETKTGGWFDVVLGVGVMTDHGRGMASVIMTFDGIKYKWGKAIECASMGEPNLKLKGCDDIIAPYNPDNPPPSP